MTTSPPPPGVDLTDAGYLHDSALRLPDGAVQTSPQQWAYAVVVPLDDAPAGGGSTLRVSIDVHVEEGRVGVGLLATPGTSFLVERHAHASARSQHLVLRAETGRVAALVLRNSHDAGTSRFRLQRIHAATVEDEIGSYPAHVTSRRVDVEAVPGPGLLLFDDDAAAAINAARLQFVRSLDLPLAGKRVLDVGAGVGHFSRVYADAGAQVVALEGRADNVAELRRRHPDVDARVADVQTADLASIGAFDLVHCFGLLYHLDSPVAVLRRIAAVCTGTMFLETIVCDADEPLMMLSDETKAVNQALWGLGCRPSPSFVVMALNRVGFPYVYGAASPPPHPDFQFAWKNTRESARDGHNLRCVFVAARAPLDTDLLIPLIET